MKGKLHENGGETLVEVMASIVIATLSVALLFGSIMASSGIDLSAQRADESYYQALSRAEAQTLPDAENPLPDALSNGKLTITAGGISQEASIQFYGGEGMYSYGKAAVGP